MSDVITKTLGFIIGNALFIIIGGMKLGCLIKLATWLLMDNPIVWSDCLVGGMIFTAIARLITLLISVSIERN